MSKNWKTTSTGIIAIISGIVGLYFAYKTNNINEASIVGTLTAILTGVGLIFAKDSNVTGGTTPQ